MPRTRSWRSLVPGLITCVAIAVLAVIVLTFARVGILHGSTERVFSRMYEARGVMKGTPVWLAGQKVGQVARVDYLPPSIDTTAHVVVVMDVLDEYMPLIRRDARAQIRSGGTLIGAPVVYINLSTQDVPAIAAGDTLGSEAQGDPETVASQFAGASRDFPAIIKNVKQLASDLENARGTTGALLNDEALELDVARRQGERLVDRALRGEGTVARALGGAREARGASGGSAVARAQTAMARADSIRALLASRRSSLGRFRRDSSLLRAVSSVRDEISIVRVLLDDARGTAGRALRDSALTQELAGTERELSRLISDLRSHPLRYVHF